jgi:hypothetical protein
MIPLDWIDGEPATHCEVGDEREEGGGRDKAEASGAVYESGSGAWPGWIPSSRGCETPIAARPLAPASITAAGARTSRPYCQ